MIKIMVDNINAKNFEGFEKIYGNSYGNNKQGQKNESVRQVSKKEFDRLEKIYDHSPYNKKQNKDNNSKRSKA